MASLTFTVNSGRSQNRNKPSNWRRRPQKKQQKKPFCKVCFDANKPEEVYTAHFLKDRPGPSGKVVCPTLLSTECRYCHDNGHFKSHCPELSKRKHAQANKAKARSTQRHQAFEAGSWMTAETSKKLDEAILSAKLQRKTSVVATAKVTPIAVNMFAGLDDSSDDEDDDNTSVFRGPSVAVAKAPLGVWAKKPAQAAPATVPAENQERIEEIQAELVELRAALDAETQASSGSWADQGEVEDLEDAIEGLEKELAGMQTIFLC